MPGADPERLVVSGAAVGDELLELFVEQFDLAVELVDASRERPQRGLGCLLGLAGAVEGRGASVRTASRERVWVFRAR